MQLKSFLIKYSTIFLLFFSGTFLSANTLVIEGVGVKGVKPTFKIAEQKALKSRVLKLDFQQIIAAQKEEKIAPANIEIPLDKLAPKVVIDDVVVFLDGNHSLEGMMVYQGATNPIQPSNRLPIYTPG